MSSSAPKSDYSLAAINEVLHLLGISYMDATVEGDVLKGRPSALMKLHRWLVAVSIGCHFKYGRIFIGELDEIKPDSSKYRAVLETINGEINCGTGDALNIVTYATLEYFQYPRLSQITLEEDQDAQELLLAFVFLLGKQRWFRKAEMNFTEYIEFRNCLVKAVNDICDDMGISQKLEKLGFESLLDNFYNCVEGPHAGVDADKGPVTTALIARPTVLAPAVTADLPLVTMLRGSNTIMPKWRSEKTKATFFSKVNPPSSSSLKRSETDSVKDVDKLLDVKRRVSGRNLKELGASSIKGKMNPICQNKLNFHVDEMMKILEKAVLEVISEFEGKAQLFCRNKSADTFDTECLRTIIGQNEQQTVFINLMDNIEIWDSSPGVNGPGEEKIKVLSKLSRLSGKASATGKDAPKKSELDDILEEVEHLSHQIIQMQSRINRMAELVENEDLERLHCFTRFSDDCKTGTIPVSKAAYKDNRYAGATDHIDVPTPAEWLLLYQDEHYAKNMSLLRMIYKSLKSESHRSSMYQKATSMIIDIKPEPPTKTTTEVESCGTADKIDMLTHPLDVIEIVDGLKRFILEGIPSENFTSDKIEECSRAEHTINEFLRQVNSSFIKFRRAKRNSGSTNKGNFIKYIDFIMKDAKAQAGADFKSYSSTKDAIQRLLHRFEEFSKTNPRINLSKLSDWIQVVEDDSDEVKRDVIYNHAEEPYIYDKRGLEERQSTDAALLEGLSGDGSEGMRINPSLIIDSPSSSSDGASLLDFNHYFHMAHEVKNSQDAKSNLEGEPRWMEWKRNLKGHDAKMLDAHKRVLKEADELFEQVRLSMPSITLIE